MISIARAATAFTSLALLAASGASGSASTPGRPAGTTTAARLRACLVTDVGGINDRSFNQLAWQGMQAAAAAKPGRIEIAYLASATTADYTRNIDAFIADKCGIIVTVGFLMASATEAAAKAHPKQKFAIVDCSYAAHCLPPHPKAPNIDQIVFNTAQDGFLGGYLAAGMSKTRVVATYGGFQFGTVTIYMDGFWDGVQYYNSRHHARVSVLGWNEKTQKGLFLDSFTSQAAGHKLTRTLIRDHADVIVPIAGGAGLGTVEAVKAADSSGKRVMVEWADTDGCFSAAQDCQFFLTSITKGIGQAVKNVVLAASRGTFAKIYAGTLANGGVGLAPYHQFADKIPAALRTEINTITSKIESGAIIPATKSPV